MRGEPDRRPQVGTHPKQLMGFLMLIFPSPVKFCTLKHVLHVTKILRGSPRAGSTGELEFVAFRTCHKVRVTEELGV